MKSKKADSSLSTSVMDSIKQKDVKMHSRLYFVVLSTILIVSTFLTSLLAAVFINLSVRDINIGREYKLHEFGPIGQDQFMSSFPWILMVLATIALISTILLARRFDISYKHKFYTLLFATFGGIALVGGGITLAGLNDDLAEDTPLRPLSSFSKTVENRVLGGQIVELYEDKYVIKTLDGRLVTIEIDEETYHALEHIYEIGDEVGVFGDSIDELRWKAKGIRFGRHKPPRGEEFQQRLEEIETLKEVLENSVQTPDPEAEPEPVSEPESE